jgi:hypothetical protein
MGGIMIPLRKGSPMCEELLCHSTSGGKQNLSLAFRQNAKRTGSRASQELPQSVHHFHITKCFGARDFEEIMDYYLFTGRAIFQQKRGANDLQETRQRELRTVSGRLLQRMVLEE